MKAKGVLERFVDYFAPRPPRLAKSLLRNPHLDLANSMAATSEAMGLYPRTIERPAADTVLELGADRRLEPTTSHEGFEVHAPAAKEPGPEVWTSPLAASDAYGLIQSIFVTGQLPKRGTRELLMLYSTSARVRSAVQRLARDVAQVPIKLFWATTPTGVRELSEYKSLTGGLNIKSRHRMRRKLMDSGDMKELSPEHPAYQFMRAGNLKLPGRQSEFMMQVFQLLKGDSYAIKVRGGVDGQVPVRWYPIPPYWVIMAPTAARPFHRCQWGTWYCDVPEVDMMWWVDPDPLNPYGRGIGVGESLADNIGAEKSASRHQYRVLDNHAMPSQLIQVEGANKIQLAQFEQKWMQRHWGTDRAGRPYFTGAKIDVKQLENSFRELELIKLRDFERQTISDCFHIPKELDGNLESANRAAAGAVRYFYLEFTVTPWVEDRVANWNQQLWPEFNEEVVADYEPFVPADEDRIQAFMTGFPQAFKVLEAREAAGYDASGDPRDDEFLSPLPVAAPAGPPKLGAGTSPKPSPVKPPKPPAESTGEDAT